jgi:hypothetical protein
MKAFKGVFTKVSGEKREMVFSRIEDLPNGFVLAKKIDRTIPPKEYPEGQELVWDLEADNYRIFNHNTAESLRELNIKAREYLDF